MGHSSKPCPPLACSQLLTTLRACLSSDEDELMDVPLTRGASTEPDFNAVWLTALQCDCPLHQKGQSFLLLSGEELDFFPQPLHILGPKLIVSYDP